MNQYDFAPPPHLPFPNDPGDWQTVVAVVGLLLLLVWRILG